MRSLRCLVPVLVIASAVAPARAAVHGSHLALLAAHRGLERWDRTHDAADAATESPLLADVGGRRNIAETNLNWAAALMRSGERPDLAERVIEAVLAHQDTAEGSPTRGLFRWYADPAEPYSADATLYLAPALAELAAASQGGGQQQALRAAAEMALQGLLSTQRPKGSFGAAMWAGAVAALGHAVERPAGQEAAAQAVGGILSRLRREGLAGVHSPTFDALRIGGLRWAHQYAPGDAARADAAAALQVCYADMLQRYDPATAMVAGAIGTAYPGEYLGTTGVAQYLLACDLPSALAQMRSVVPLVMYFALSDYALPADLLALAESDRRGTEIRTRTPAQDGAGIEATSTCTWVGDGMSLGTMSGPVDGSCVPILATCDLPERPTSYVYPFGGPATLSSAQTGGLALCSFNFDGVGLGPRTRVGVACVLGRRDQIDRVLIGRHEWIGEPEAVGQNAVVAMRRGRSYVGLKILDVGPAAGTPTAVKPGGIEWFPEGNMDSLVLKIYGRQADYPLPKPLFDVKVGLLVEVAPASQFGGLEEFAQHLSGRRASQSTREERMRTDDSDRRVIPGRDELRTGAEIKFARYLYHEMALRDETLPLGLTEELLRNQLVSRTLPVELPEDYLWVSPALTLMRGGEPVIGPQP